MKRILDLALCAREKHKELPEEAIFPSGFFTNGNDYKDFRKMSLQCQFILGKYNPSETTLMLYVTGLGQALGAVINYCLCRSMSLVLMHWDKDTKSYIEQPMNVIDFPIVSPHLGFNNRESLEEDIDTLLSSCDKTEGFSQGVYW
jgi:hypothetical protein